MAAQQDSNMGIVGRFSGDVAMLSAGAAVAQLITVAGSPLLTRLYTASEFGMFALFIAASGVVGQIACLKYDMAVVVAPTDEQARSLFFLCLATCAATAGLLLAALPFSSVIGRMLSVEDFQWLWFLPFAAMLLGAHAALSALALRGGLLRQLSASTVLRALAQLLTQVLLFRIRSGGVALCAAYLLSYAAAVLLLSIALRDMFRGVTIAPSQLLRQARLSAAYPIWTTPGALANTMVYSLSSFVVSSRASSAMLGCYSLVNRILAAPLTVLTGPVSQLFLRRIARRDPCRRTSLFLGVSGTMLLLGATAGVGLWAVSPLMPVLFGGGWGSTGPILRVMLPLFVIRFTVSPVSVSGIVAQRQRATMLWQFIMLALSVASAMLAGWYELTAVGYLALFSALLIGGYLIFWLYCLHTLQKEGNR